MNGNREGCIDIWIIPTGKMSKKLGVWEYVILDPSYIGPPDGKLGEFGEDCNMSKCVWTS